MNQSNIVKLTQEDYEEGEWFGGTTTQIAVYPSEEKYSERNFLWRISTAVCQCEESEFTFLPDYDRTLIVLEGEVILEHKEVRTKKLQQFESDSFSGHFNTKSYGKMKDFNLMVRKGIRGNAEVIELQETNEKIDFNTDSKGCLMTTQGIYCCEDFAVLNINGESCMLQKGQTALWTGAAADVENISIMGKGKAVKIQVYFEINENGCEKAAENLLKNVRTDEEGRTQDFTSEKEEKITLDDVLMACLLCWSNFRGGRHIFRFLKDKWYDKELQKGIGKLENLCIPMLVCGIGVVALGYLFLENYGSEEAILAIGIWLVADYLLISPALYLLVLPRPVRKHIKKIDSLTGEEKNLYLHEKTDNPIARNILKKYKITGRNKYIE